MKTELTMGKWYTLNGGSGFMYFGVNEFGIEHGNLGGHIFACRIENLWSSENWVYPIHLDNIEVEGGSVTSKNGRYPNFRLSDRALINIGTDSLNKGLTRGIKRT